MYVHYGYGLINKEIDFHITKNSTSLLALGFIFYFFKDFWEPMLVDMRVILLVEVDTAGEYLHPYIESRTLTVYTCMYIMVTDSSTRR